MTEQDVVDVLVVGTGGAGLRAAIEASDQGASTMLVSKGAMGKSGATLIAGAATVPFTADLTLDGAGATKIGLFGNEEDSKERLFHDIVIQGYYLNNQRIVEAYVRDAPIRCKEMIDWGMKYLWDGRREIATQGTELNRVLVQQVKKRGILAKDDLYVTDLLRENESVVGAMGVDINRGVIHAIIAKAVVIATGGWQRAYSFTTAPAGNVGALHAAAYRAGADLINMEMVTFCPMICLWPPALRGDDFPYVLMTMFGDLLEKHGRPFLRDEYDPQIYRIAISTEWNKLIFSTAATRVVMRGGGSPRGGTYYSIKNVPLNILQEAEKIYPMWRRLRTNYADLIDWLKDGNAVEVAPAAHYMEGGILVDEHGATTVKGLYAAGECSGGLFGANRVASAITQILVQGAIAGKSAATYSKKAQLQNVGKRQISQRESRLTRPFNRRDGIRAIDLKKRIMKIADENLWVFRNAAGLKQAVSDLQSIILNDISRVSIQTQTRTYNKEWIDALEVEAMAQVLLASARSALFRTESRGVHNRSDYPVTDNGRWLREIVVRQVNGKASLSTRPVTITKLKPPRVKFNFEEGIIRAVKELGE
jgi:succinate dehydrogenase/fumarate reductase flavoprotein subunit